MKLFKIAFSNIKKRKSGAITLAAITAVAVLMLAISLMLLFGIGSFYETKAEEFNTPHITIMLNGCKDEEINDVYDYALNYKNVKEIETKDGYCSNIKYEIKNNTVKTQMIFSNESDIHTMSTYTIIDKMPSKPENGIILPLSFKFEGSKAGEKFSIQSGSKTYDFTIYGFFEDVQFGSTMSTIKMAYVTSDIYDTISSENNFMQYKFISIMFQKLTDSYNFESDFVKAFENSNITYFSASYDDSRSGVTMFPTIMALALILVSAIVVLVALIIARFTIINNIEEDIKTLGALKSVGFTSKQIIWSMVFQFLLVALIGAALGSIATLALGGVIGNVISSTSGLLWTGASMFVPIIIALLAVMGVIVLITYLMARKTKKITPINALRSGISNHTFKKNTAPFDKSKMPLNINIAAKNFIGNLKNNITAFIMVFMFAFLTVLGFTLYHNFVTDTEAFRQMSGLELNGVLIQFPEDSATENFNEIKKNTNIRKTVEFNYLSLNADGKFTYLCVWEDITKKEANSLVEGSYPKLDDEISIPATLKSKTGKKLGEMISLEFEGKLESYRITGITQTPGNPACDLTKEGFTKLKKDFIFTGMYIYLNDNSVESMESFMNSLTDDYGRDIYMENTSDIMDAINGTIAGPVELATYLILIIEVFVICFVFFLMVSTIIRCKKKEAGIMKALGFTSRQLILQTFLSFLPVIIGGILLGTIAGVFLTNMLLGLMFAGIVAKATFTIPPLLTIISEIALVVICILTVYLVSLKFKRIAPQKLITEQ